MGFTNSRIDVRPRKDRRPLVAAIALISVLILSQLFAWWYERGQAQLVRPVERESGEQARAAVYALLRPQPDGLAVTIDPDSDPDGHVRQARKREMDARFRQGAAMLHAGRYEEAVTALHRLLELSPEMPEAHVNMGYALLGLGRFDAALAFFQGAADLKPMLTNAYYGMAMAHEGRGSLRKAVESMETYLHLEREDAHYLRLSSAAVWEWRAQLAEEAGPDSMDGSDAVPESQGDAGGLAPPHAVQPPATGG